MRKVMVVEDDSATRFMMSEFLDTLGFECTVTRSCSECLSELLSNPADYAVILMDIHMPAVTGLDTASYIRDINVDPPRSIPIVAVTADSRYHSPEAVSGFGMDNVLPKPVDMSRLNRLLRDYV